MARILGISGSLRAGSLNTALLRAAQLLMPDDVELEIATLHGIPLYDGDVEQRDGIPAAVVTLRAQIIAADGVILASPEYNNSVPGVLKNAIDWLSRPPSEIPRTFGNKPYAVMGASMSGFGTILAQNAWLSVLRHLGARQWGSGRLLVSKAQQSFDATGKLTDEAVAKQLGEFVNGFAAFATRS
ncbi:MAG: NADPH-dependent FMN reductase [Steroidobacteraceae bacterium]